MKIFIFFLLAYINNVLLYLQLIISWYIYTIRNPHTEQPVSYIVLYKINQAVFFCPIYYISGIKDSYVLYLHHNTMYDMSFTKVSFDG